ncbi:unnamed protein product [Rotaria sordida]|uniref:Transmembrane protein n=1 Tax=Rotaria sordida TaxID=392033 RepID=A0A819JMJ8_9BILA|nr:unnamed protein product [Rotaria sordida]CAF3931665.1 unnamed protein product [Rotaria sordida]
MSEIRHSFIYFIQYSIVLKLILVAFIFIINLSRLCYNQLSFQLINRNLIIQHQNFYTTVLWKYLNVIYNKKHAIGEMKKFIIFQFLSYQLLMYDMENIILNQISSDQSHPLMKSVVCLS